MPSVIEAIRDEYLRYKHLGEAAIRQLKDDQLSATTAANDNSVATIVWHIGGNLRSRFTDFLTTDGEKPWRDRDSEFLQRTTTQGELLDFWNQGWAVLLGTLDGLTDDDLFRNVVIRGQQLTVIEALQRSLAHASYHVGQIVFLAKGLRGSEWTYLSIPPGKSKSYNQNPTLESPLSRT